MNQVFDVRFSNFELKHLINVLWNQFLVPANFRFYEMLNQQQWKIQSHFNTMWILTVKNDTPFKNKNISWERPDRNGVYLFKVSFGNMTRDASFLKIMLISGLTVMIVLVVYTKINLQQPIVTCNRIHIFGIW